MNETFPPADYEECDEDSSMEVVGTGLTAIANAIKALTEGDDRPRGLEGLTMAIAGDPQSDRSLASTIASSSDEVTRALDGIAEAIQELAAAVRGAGGKAEP